MRKMRSVILILALILVSQVQPLFGQQDCIRALIQDKKDFSSYTASSYALFQLVQEKFSEEERKALGINMVIDNNPVDINNAQTQLLMRQFSKQTNIKWTEQNKNNNGHPSKSEIIPGTTWI